MGEARSSGQWVEAMLVASRGSHHTLSTKKTVTGGPGGDCDSNNEKKPFLRGAGEKYGRARQESTIT